MSESNNIPEIVYLAQEAAIDKLEAENEQLSVRVEELESLLSEVLDLITFDPDDYDAGKWCSVEKRIKEALITK